jgi:hypothetical protein
VLPHDFDGLIAENAFGAGVPAEQSPVEPDQENGVLFGVGRQQVESLAQFLRREAI